MKIDELIVIALAGGVALSVARAVWIRDRVVAMGVLVWLALAMVINRVGVFSQVGTWSEGDLLRYCLFGTVMFVPVLMYLTLDRPARAMAALPTWALAALQCYRLGGFVFLVGLLNGVMPAALAWPTFILDSFVGVTALPLAYWLSAGGGRRPAFAWCAIGLFDFANAIVLISLSVTGVWAMHPAPSAIGQSPFLLISLFQLPLAVVLHIELVRRMIRSDSCSS